MHTFAQLPTLNPMYSRLARQSQPTPQLILDSQTRPPAGCAEHARLRTARPQRSPGVTPGFSVSVSRHPVTALSAGTPDALTRFGTSGLDQRGTRDQHGPHH